MKKCHHVCIQTDCYEASLDFYTRVMAFAIVKETKHFHERLYNTWLECDGFMIELQTNREHEVLTEYSDTQKGLVHFCFMVEDVECEYERIKALGYNTFKYKPSSKSAIYEVEGGKLLKIVAPEGTIIEIRDKEL